MSTRLATVLVAGLLVLAGCAGGVTSAPAAAAADADPGTTISVSATGEVSAPADLARIHVSVVATADSADSARSRIASDAERMRTALRDAGVPDDAVTTTSFAIYPEYRYDERERELVGYRAIHSYRIEVAPDRAGEVVDVAVGNGAAQVDGVQFTLTDDTRRDLRAQALADAVTAARADADTVAAAAGLSVTGVRTVSTGGNVAPVFDARFAESGDGESTTLEPGPVRVSAAVSVTYTAA